MHKDILGNALLDFLNGKYTEDIKTILKLNPKSEVEKDDLPLPYLFRTYQQMPKLEKEALKRCHGAVLDIGCGAGNHSLYLQENGFQVTALDSSPGAIETCSKRGIKNYVNSDIMNYTGAQFDTLLLLMNGIGIAGSLKKLNLLFEKLKTLLHQGGQILLDSSDIIYMFEKDNDGGYWIPDNSTYYGEVQFQMEYKKQTGAPFEWLYIDFNTLHEVAKKHNLRSELVSQGEHYDYLARITSK